MSETETNPAAGKPSCDLSKETRTPFINDKSDFPKNRAANPGPSYKNRSISQFSESAKTKHKADSHKLSVVNPQAQVKTGYTKTSLISPSGN